MPVNVKQYAAELIPWALYACLDAGREIILCTLLHPRQVSAQQRIFVLFMGLNRRFLGCFFKLWT